MPSFTSAFNVGDACYIFDNQGKGQLTSVLDIDFRVGTNFAAFNANTDFIYKMVFVDPVTADPVERSQEFTFVDKPAMITYIGTLP
jgi:hypothetical protein